MHIYYGMKGMIRPPRIIFSDPVGERDWKFSEECIIRPFVMGAMVNKGDAGEGFHMSMVEGNPATYYADVHSSLAVPGANRGQFA
jgi:hypothetical protein